MSSIQITNNTNLNLGLPGQLGTLSPMQTRTWTGVSVAEIERMGPGLTALQAAGKIAFNVFNPTSNTAAQNEVVFANVEDIEWRANLVQEEFTNPAAANTSYFLGSTATAATASDVTVFAANSLATPRNVTITRSAATGAYTTSVITIVAVLNGVPVTLTFTPATADGGDTIQSNEKIGVNSLTSIHFPAQVSTAGAFTVGFGTGLGLRFPVKSRAGLVNTVREIAIGAVVTTGTVVTQLYTPAAAPNGTNDYALLYERA